MSDDITDLLQACVDDLMWADHAEVPKAWCAAAASEIRRLRDALQQADLITMNNDSTPGALGSDDQLGPGVDAGHVSPGAELYKVTDAHAHKTLKVGDLVRVVEDPRYNNLLLRTDWTLHFLADENDQYVHLRLV